MFETGVSEKEAEQLNKDISALLTKLEIINAEHRLVLILNAARSDAVARGVTGLSLGIMVMNAWSKANKQPQAEVSPSEHPT